MLNTVLATLLLIANAAGNVVDLFTTLALLSTFVYVLTYVLAVAAFLMRIIRGQTTQTGRPLALETLAAGLALAFSIWMIGATGEHTAATQPTGHTGVFVDPHRSPRKSPTTVACGQDAPVPGYAV